MKVDLTTKELNKYVTEVEICGKRFTLTNNRKRAEDKLAIRKEIKSLEKYGNIAVMFLVVGFFLAVGTVGHSEMLDELRLPEDMTTFQYFVRYMISLALGAVGLVIAKRVEYLEEDLKERYDEI